MKKGLFVFACTLIVLSLVPILFYTSAQQPAATSATARRETSAAGLADFDIRADLQRTQEATEQAQTKARALQQTRPTVQLRWSSLTGTPSRLYSFTQTLSEPSNEDAETIAKRFFKRQAALFQLSAQEVDALRAVRQYRSEHNGVTHLTLRQSVGDIEIFQGEYALHLDRSGAILAAGGELIPNPSEAVRVTAARLTATSALRQAATYAGSEITGALNRRTEPTTQAQRQRFRPTDGARIFSQDVEAQLVYFPIAANQLRLAWEFTLWMRETPDVYHIVVDAERGALLYRQNLTWYCGNNPASEEHTAVSTLSLNARSYPAFANHKVFAQTQTGPRGLVFTLDSPRPANPYTTDTPALAERRELPFRATPFNGVNIFPANDPHEDWWAGQPATGLISNNTDTHLDRNNDSVADQPLVTVENGNFTFPLDLTKAPTEENNQKAAQANLFYWVNRYHDILYLFGFNEAAGNFQTNNFGKGGFGNDALFADAQDGGGLNNANYAGGRDGTTGRIQMYLWTGNPQLDGSLDQGIILHELSHGLSTRLVSNLFGVHGSGMGEGWSDYFGIVLLRSANDDLDGSYGVGQYVTNNQRRGIRRFPYNNNTKIYPFGYGDLAVSNEVHDVGEIWCNMLLEMRAALIRRHGFPEGQRQSIQLVVDGLKLSPSGPTFVDARNAIMLADRVNNGGANQCLLWQAFSKHGLGFSASALDARDGFPNNATDMPSFCTDLGTIRFDQKNYLLGETAKIFIGDRNAIGSLSIRVRSSVTGDQETLPLTPSTIFVGDYSTSIRTAPGAALAGDGVLQASLTVGDKIIVTYDDANSGTGSPAQITAQSDIAGEKTIFDDNVERGNLGWQVRGKPTVSWGITETRAASPARAWADSPTGNAAANSDVSLVSPLFDFSRAGSVVLTFAQSYILTTGLDYAIVEASLDDGVSWNRVTAFSGVQSSFAQTRLTLDALAGQAKARVRFRLLTTTATDGWTIDDIRIIVRTADRAELPTASELAPQILGLSPAFGSPVGGTAVTISGANFTQDSDVRVLFDGIPATNVRVLGSTTIAAINPPRAAGKSSVRVETRYGTATLGNAFTYHLNGSVTSAPELINVFPATGAIRGGAIVTVNGANFTPETTVQFGGQNARASFINANTLRVTTPAANAPGSVEVTANNIPNATTPQAKLTGAFTYTTTTPPTVRLLSPGGGERIYTGATIPLQWQSADNRALSRHRLQLYNGTTAVTTIADNLPGEAQSFVWNLPSSLPAIAQARIRVVAIDDEGTEAEAFSSSTFTLLRRWETMPNLPGGLNRLAAVSEGQYLYSIGGRLTGGNATAVTTVQRFDPAASAAGWTALAPLPKALNALRATALSGKIHVPGGINVSAEIERVHFVYDVAANNWTTLEPPPTGVLNYGLATDTSSSIFYMTGGSDLTAGVTTVQTFDTKTNLWKTLPPLQEGRFAHESIFANGKLYVIGGISGAGTLASGEVFDPATQKWAAIAPMNLARSYMTSVLARDTGGRLLWLIIGGENNSALPLGSLEAYDFANDRWTLLDGSYDQPQARARAASAVLQGTVYTLGGLSATSFGTTTASTNERLSLDGIVFNSINQPPVVVVPAGQQIATANQALKFIVSAQDLGASSPVTLTATDLPAGATFTVSNQSNNSAQGVFQWTPGAADMGRSFTLNFAASDGTLSEIKSVVVNVVSTTSLAAVNAGDFRGGMLAPDSIAVVFGANLAPRAEIAQSFPLNTELSGVTLTVNGIAAPLFYISPTQINFLVPAGVGPGLATIIVKHAVGGYALGTTEIVSASPALFTADATGRGDAVALATADGVNYQTAPFDVSVNGRPNVLILFGTGLRRAMATNPSDDNGVAESVSVTVDGQSARVLYAGAQGTFAGLDQLNVELPATLAGVGPRRVTVQVSVNGGQTNPVTILLK